jgi:lipopolysaccharide export LptBFGC system permease protein LptF
MGSRLIRILDFISQGIPVSSVLKFIAYIMPLVMANGIPVAILVSIMLIFGRMSADSEITAMRACGISILQIISPIILIVFILTCICFYLRMDVVPYTTWQAGSFIKKVVVDQPLSIFVPGRPIRYEEFMIQIDDKVGKNGVKNIQVFRMADKGRKVSQDITAPMGKITVDKEKQILNIVLNNAAIAIYNDEGIPTRTFSKELTFPIDYGKKFNEIRIAKDVDDLSFDELFGRAVLHKKIGKDNTRVEIELNQRFALALAPIAFMLLGMPLAIRTSRRETSVGLFLSVILAGVYYSLVMIFKALDQYPQYHPQVLLWIPNIVYQFGGTYYLFKIAKR